MPTGGLHPLSGWFLGPVLVLVDFLHSRRRSYYLFFTTCKVYPKQRGKLPWITADCGKTSSQEAPGAIFSGPKALHLRGSVRGRQSGTLQPSLLADGDPTVGWKASRARESRRPEPWRSSSPSRPPCSSSTRAELDCGSLGRCACRWPRRLRRRPGERNQRPFESRTEVVRRIKPRIVARYDRESENE